MTDNNSPVQVLSTDESLELLATKTFGRLVVHRTNDVDLFPLNYTVSEGKIYLRTAEGTKLFSLNLNGDVLFEADNVEQTGDATGEAWSVIVKGQARILTTSDEINAAEELPLKPWLPTLKYNFVEITPNEDGVSGRHFNLGAEPERF
ncbi:pyridoxamine 5'-phosphate oxidase family protein, partial [Corynebacterium nuruki]|jgi:nitroimidazol reductase NimA-like FMN-containing flavoprotein (pyridoxamine 5'-phosphate oxidase superfamily)|uniref:Pyridoxamine 5'-phosphate oxidase family protein n=1 Tax=Corynebacterium nuruki TaxID=1032851 RepID=A0A3D4SZV7_9CORY